MRILLPPSETKRSGGTGPQLNLPGFSEPGLNSWRSTVVDAVQRLAENREDAARILKLSARQLASIDENATLSLAPTMPALERYTGVLYDALDVSTLRDDKRTWANQHVFIQSAAFGRVAATDLIPAYRLSASTALPGLSLNGRAASLKAFWVDAHESLQQSEQFTLDLRSKDYVALAPLSPTDDHAWVNVVQQDESGIVRALNHFNKTAKGELVRLLALTQPVMHQREDFFAWAHDEQVLCGNEPTGPITVFADSISLRARRNGSRRATEG